MPGSRALSSSPPAWDGDFYSDSFIRDPLPRYRAMRECGSVIWMSAHGNFAATRYAQVREVLRNDAVFSSASGVAADDAGCTFMKGNTLASDAPRHNLLRGTMSAPLLPGALEHVRGKVRAAAEELIETLLDKQTFDGIADLARHLPLAIVTELVGLPEDGRENMLKWAAGGFDILGIQNERGRAGVETVKEMRTYINERARPGALKPGSWTDRIFKLAAAGTIADELCPLLVRDYIGPSLDTTISATGQLIYQLGKNPHQWKRICDDPALIPGAVNEAVRLGTPIRSFTRTALCNYVLDGHLVPRGARIMAVYACANRDELAFDQPDAFIPDRKGPAHVGFGHGPHTCVGMHLARMEMEALLCAMVERVERIEVGEPTIAMNNTIAAFETLPVVFAPARRNGRITRTGLSAIRAQRWTEARIAACERRGDIMMLELEPEAGTAFTPFEAGAHIDMRIAPGIVRQYSLCGDPARSDRYELAILRETASRGGSQTIHERAAVGLPITIGRPRNNFTLDETAERSVLLAGGIGITPLLAMSWRLHRLGAAFDLHYCVRDLSRAAFERTLSTAPFSERTHVHSDRKGETDPFDLVEVIGQAGPHARYYCCGPEGFIAYVRATLSVQGVAPENLRLEHFGASPDVEGAPFTVIARRSGLRLEIPSDRTIRDILREAGVEVETSCLSGVCGSCLTEVIEGVPDHRDKVQTEDEKLENKRIAVCCSRSRTGTLILDI